MVGRHQRRNALRYLGASGVSLLAGCARSSLDPADGESAGGEAGSRGDGGAAGTGSVAPSCVVRPVQTEGPYFIDERLNRSDIRSDPVTGVVKPGVRLDLTLRVSGIGPEAGRCTPLAGAIVDLWQCDALGAYSDVLDSAGSFDTRGQKFLRGYQLSDGSGAVRFVTIYPGWYDGRTIHLHFKVRTPAEAAQARSFTSQLYFDDGLNDAVMALEPYRSRGPRSVSNADDGIYRSGGSELSVPLVPTSAGYAGLFELGIELG